MCVCVWVCPGNNAGANCLGTKPLPIFHRFCCAQLREEGSTHADLAKWPRLHTRADTGHNLHRLWNCERRGAITSCSLRSRGHQCLNIRRTSTTESETWPESERNVLEPTQTAPICAPATRSSNSSLLTYQVPPGLPLPCPPRPEDGCRSVNSLVHLQFS